MSGFREVTIGECRLIQGDCADVLAEIDADVVITDPPYGVNLGAHGAANEKRPQYLAKAGYDGYDDTPENFETQIVPRLKLAIDAFGRAVVFSAGTQMWSLPRPDAVGGVFLPAGCGRNKWGFNCFAHFCMYGDCPDLNLGARPTGFSSTETADDNGHPCPKPVGWMERIVKHASRETETVLDPFMGSGTTGVACVKHNRRFIGVEREPKYFDIACRRIEQAYADQGLYTGAMA